MLFEALNKMASPGFTFSFSASKSSSRSEKQPSSGL